VIVRIATEGQYELDDDDDDTLKQLDNQAVVACDSDDEQQFQDHFQRLLEFVRDNGRPVDESRLEPSDVIIPPPDTTLEEAKAEFSGEGLIPG
jgi:PspA-Associated protein